MAGLIPFNRKNNSLARTNTGFEDFYNMLDDFFNDSCDILCISVNHSEEVNKNEKNYIHRERRSSSMSRSIRLANAKLDEAKAKLEDGVLTVTIPKDEKATNLRKIDIE
jgi:HSP20 family protein